MLDGGRDSDTEERQSCEEALAEAEGSQGSWTRHEVTGRQGTRKCPGKVDHPHTRHRLGVKDPGEES